MQLLAIGLAASLVLGSAPQPDSPEPDGDAVTHEALPDVDTGVDSGTDAAPVAESTPEPEPELNSEPETAPPEPPPPVITPTPTADPNPVVRDNLGCGGVKACRKMTIAGIVVGVVGLGAVGSGIGLLVKDDEVLADSPTYVTSTHPAGLVAVTIGAGVTLTAVLMLVAAHKGYKQRGDQARLVPVAPLANGLRF